MNTNDLLQMLFYILPALIVGIVSVNFFKGFVENENEKRRFELVRQNRKDALPLQLQAYERLTLLMDRISVSKLAVRVTPLYEDKDSYVNLLCATVDQEFEHNITQQIYVSDECWLAIIAAKNATLQFVRETALNHTSEDANSFRTDLLTNSVGNIATSSLAINMLRTEVKKFIS